MQNDTVGAAPAAAWRGRARVIWAIVTVFFVESVILSLAVLPAVAFWTWHSRWTGVDAWARIGRGAWVNSLSCMDHDLLDLGDGAVIGSNAYVSGHVVEAGMLKTARVRIGRHATIGINSVVGIGADIGEGAQVGALSVVPKGARLEPGGVYAGAPVRLIASGAK